jgi:hypothetical protein
MLPQSRNEVPGACLTLDVYQHRSKRRNGRGDMFGVMLPMSMMGILTINLDTPINRPQIWLKSLKLTANLQFTRTLIYSICARLVTHKYVSATRRLCS